VRDLATAVGSFGMVGGQHVDLEAAAKQTIDFRTLEYIQSHKTGSLFVIAATIGPILMGTPDDRVAALALFGRNLGLAYQIVDDILDAEGDAECLGKEVGQDSAKHKKNFVTVCGLAPARQLARDLVGAAKDALPTINGRTEILCELADYCLDRTF
jgi:geranylgeranyl pyrophosphate synthase